MKDCIFCKIIDRKIPAEIVYEDETSLAFLDINPINKGHTLVIPKQHFETLNELPQPILDKTMVLVKKIVKALSKYADGVNLGLNNGRAAGQVVFHVHFHLMPRFEGDGFKLWSGKPYGEGEVQQVAREIRTLL